VRVVPALVCIVWLAFPAAARGQSFELYASAGPTVTDPGASLTAGVGVALSSQLTLSGGVEWIHLVSERRDEGGSTSYVRGGSFLLGSAQLRVAPLGRDRVGPFVLGGFAAGVSRPTVNAIFPTPVTNNARVVFGGGGLLVPLRARVSVFAEAHVLFGVEGSEGIVTVVPVLGGIAWRF